MKFYFLLHLQPAFKSSKSPKFVWIFPLAQLKNAFFPKSGIRPYPISIPSGILLFGKSGQVMHFPSFALHSNSPVSSLKAQPTDFLPLRSAPSSHVSLQARPLHSIIPFLGFSSSSGQFFQFAH